MSDLSWVGTCEGTPPDSLFGTTKGAGTPLVIDTLSNKGYFYKSGVGPTPLAGGIGYRGTREVSASGAVLTTDEALIATTTGLTLTVPKASDFEDGDFLHFFLDAIGTLTVEFAPGDSVLGL